MSVQLPAWPQGLPKTFRPLARTQRRFDPFSVERQTALDVTGPRMEEYARRLWRTRNDLQAGGLTNTWTELASVNRVDFNAFSNSASEGSIIAGTNQQPAIPALYFDQSRGFGRSVYIMAQGVLGTTSTPTITFQVRMSSTAGTGTLSGASLGVSAAITTSSGVSNKWWQLQLYLTCYTPGQGTGNATLSGAGFVQSPGGFASPFLYPLEPTTPDTATWTQTFDDTLSQYINLSVTWSAASASNTITTKQLWMWGMN